MNQKENKKDYAKIIGNLAPYIGLVAVIILFEALTGGALLSSGNVQALINPVIVTALAALVFPRQLVPWFVSKPEALYLVPLQLWQWLSLSAW